MEARDTRYEAVFDHLHNTYAHSVLNKLSLLRATLIEEGFAVSEPYDMLCDEYRWSMLAWAPGREANDAEQGFDISITISEQRVYDGDKDEHGNPIFGLNFGLDMVDYGGEIIGGLAPFNYTEDCWVDGRDVQAVENRWKLIEDCDNLEGAEVALAFYKSKEIQSA